MSKECYICMDDTTDKKFFKKSICNCKNLYLHIECYISFTIQSYCTVCKKYYDNIYINKYNKVERYIEGFKEVYFLSKKGEKQGIYESFYPSENIFISCYFIKGLRDGIFRKFFPNGKLHTLETFSKGIRNGVYICWNDKGELHQKIEYIGGIINGKVEVFYENGKYKFICSMYNNKLEGKLKAYYSNGIREFKGYFKNGFLHGRVQKWDIQGFLTEDSLYENDILKGIYITEDLKIKKFFHYNSTPIYFLIRFLLLVILCLF
jgi:antitoxin component YwqK of YwqJK toxin-antitoxin module